ncbi:MAG: nucleotide exchange factor GrpE [Clostridiales bacterium]|jgi:molecular chaperone GrpE|nr:nucleotide exchange factor GrpE [Clostridiales bacterium]
MGQDTYNKWEQSCDNQTEQADGLCEGEDQVDIQKDDETGNEKQCKYEEEHKCSCENEGLPTVEELQEQLNKVISEKNEYLSLAQRLQADFDNYRKRNKSALAEAYESATVDTISAFLPVLDNLERALESASSSSSDDSIVKGIEMVTRQFVDVLKKLGVEEIEALGKTFDPQLHNAVMKTELEDGMEENTVVEVIQKGYKYKDRVIRYSMVKVAVSQ